MRVMLAGVGTVRADVNPLMLKSQERKSAQIQRTNETQETHKEQAKEQVKVSDVKTKQYAEKLDNIKVEEQRTSDSHAEAQYDSAVMHSSRDSRNEVSNLKSRENMQSTSGLYNPYASFESYPMLKSKYNYVKHDEVIGDYHVKAQQVTNYIPVQSHSTLNKLA